MRRDSERDMLHLFVLVACSLAREARGGVAYGTVVRGFEPRAEPSVKPSLVNRVSVRSATDRPMALSSELYWTDTDEEFARSHVVGKFDASQLAQCETDCERASFRKVEAYYSWSSGMPVSAPIPCATHERCHAVAEFPATSHAEFSPTLLGMDLLLFLTNGQARIPVAVARAANSTVGFDFEFSGPNCKQMMFKALYYTIRGEMQCMDAAPETHPFVIDLPVLLPSMASDGVFYLADA